MRWPTPSRSGPACLRRRLAGLLLTLAAAAGTLGLLPVSLIDTLDNAVYDGRLRMSVAPPDRRVMIVDIDEASIARVGRWPWQRARMGELAGALIDRGGARVVGLDLVFAEPQHAGDEDADLARQLAGRPVVLGYYFTADRGGRTSGALPDPVLGSEMLVGLDTGGITRWDGFGANLASLQKNAAGAGFFNPLIDPDGTVRALPLMAQYQGGLYESLAVSVLRHWLGSARVRLDADELSLHGERGSVRLPLSDGLTALVPYAGRISGMDSRASRFDYVSAADVLEGRVDWARFRDRVVLVGSSAPGLTDLRATPIRAAFPGVEIHATLIAAALDSVNPDPHAGALLLTRSAAATGLGALVVLVVGAALAMTMPVLGALGAVTLSGAAALTIWGSAGIAWNNLGMVIPVSAAQGLVVLLLIFNLTAGYFVEGRTRRAMADLFGEYLSPALVERMVRDPARLSASGSENRVLTILFVDIRGFTRIAETMPPEGLREYLNTFLTAMTEVVHRHGGTVDKYIGDSVMAFWGAPLPDRDHADHAVRAALAMLDEVSRLNRVLRLRGLPPMHVGVGVNTGLVRVGDMGSRLRRTYTVIGDPVNLAARFEALTKLYDQPIIVGESTAQQARGHRFAPLGKAPLAGRHEPVLIFTPVSLAASDTIPMQDGMDDVMPATNKDRVDAGAGIGL
jgi:adenylate cyclase